MQENQNSVPQAGLIFMGMFAEMKMIMNLFRSSDFLTNNYPKGPESVHTFMQKSSLRQLDILSTKSYAVVDLKCLWLQKLV